MKRLFLGGGLLQAAVLFLLFAAFSRPAEAGTTTRVPDCGYLNARPCTPFDNEAYNIYFGFSTQCDFGLYVDTHNKCVNASRDTISKQRRTWVQWALSEQRGHVSSRIPLNFNTTFGTHNSYSSYNSGFQSIITTDQKLSLYDQLEAGARAVRLDPWYYFGNMRLCHSTDVELCETFSPIVIFSAGTIGSALNLFFPGISIFGVVEGILSPGRLYAYSVRELADWLDRHPGEFVTVELHNQDFDTAHSDLLRAPLLEYLGDRILTPAELNRITGKNYAFNSTNIDWPTLEAIRSAKKADGSPANYQVLLFAETNFPDSNGTHIAFRSGTGGGRNDVLRGLLRANTTFPECGVSPGVPLWDSSTRGVFYQSGEDRSLSGLFLNPVEYLNVPETRDAVRCGVSIVRVDFLLGQELSIIGDTAQKPDKGEDRRREAAIWSWDEGDYGNRGAAFMKSNGRWSSDNTNAAHHYACALKPSLWPYPRYYPTHLDRVQITRGSGWFYGGDAMCQQEFGADFVFYAPASGPENELLKARYNVIDVNTGTKFGDGGVWMNYVSTMGNLLSLSDGDLSFHVNVPNASAAAQQVTLSGPPGASIAAPATISVNSASPVFLQNPGALTLDASGSATINLALRPEVLADLKPGVYANRILYVLPGSLSGGSSNQSVISQAIINVTLIAQGQGSLVVGGAACSGTVCTVGEGQSAPISMTYVRPVANNFPIAGQVEVRKVSTDANFETSVDRITTPTALIAFPLAGGGGYLTGSQTQNVTLPPGSHQLGAFFSGGLVDSPATSSGLTLNVVPYLNPNPASRTLKVDPSKITAPSPAFTISVVNTLSLPLTVTTECANGVTTCWLSASGSGTSVAVQYTAAVKSLKPGTYNALVRISDGIHATVTVPVSLNATGDLILSTTSLNLLAALQPVTTGVTGSINGSTVPLEYRVVSGGRIARIEQGRIVVDPTGLAPGLYDAAVEASSAYSEIRPTVSIRMQVVPPSSVNVVPDGIPFTVDGTTYLSSQTFAWAPGSAHTISVPSLASIASGNYLFARWSDSGAMQHPVVAPTSAAQSWTATFDAAFPVTSSVSPAGSGSVSLNPAPEQQGLYRSGTPVSVSATPATGYVFRGFLGDLSGTQNPQTVTVSAARTLVAQFAPGSPTLVAVPGAVNNSATPSTIAVQLLNRGTVPATGAQILSVTNVRVVSGTGTVTPVTQTANLGNIQPGASATGTLSFNWPATATRIQFTVNFGDASGYRGSTTVAVFR